MGYLLKEALKTLCGVNQWSYAVFWKIGCQNPKLLIWEECYYGLITYSGLPQISGIEDPDLAIDEWEACWSSAETRSSLLGVQAGESVQLLVNKMMMDNHVNVVGEGLVGRAAFSGNYQWILSQNYTREAHPPEVLNEVLEQFSAGMQTIAVIPVLPHGVVQLGSSLTVMESMKFVNDVKALILQLGCVPGTLFSDNYATNGPSTRIGVSSILGKSASTGFSGKFNIPDSFIADNYNQQHSPAGSRLVGRTSNFLIRQIQDNLQSSSSSFQYPQTSVQSNVHDKSEVIPVMKPKVSVRCKLENGVTSAEVTPSNPDVWWNQEASFCVQESRMNQQPSLGTLATDYASLRFMEQQILANAVLGDHVEDDASNSFTSQTTGGLVSVSHKYFSSAPSHEPRDFRNDVDGHLLGTSNPPSLTNPHRPAKDNILSVRNAQNRFQNVASLKTEPSISDFEDHLTTNHFLSDSSDHKQPYVDKKCTQVEFDEGKKLGNDLFQAIGITFPSPDQHIGLSENMSGFFHDGQKNQYSYESMRLKNTQFEDAYVKPQSGDDLFDIVGVDLKSKILDESWNNFLNNDPEPNSKNLDKSNCALDKLQDEWSQLQSVDEGNSESGIFSVTATDHLLDAVVSRVRSAVKQSSDDNVSCRTTLTKLSCFSGPTVSLSSEQANVSNQMQGELSGIPKSLTKASAFGSSTFLSGSCKEESGNNSQTNSYYGSQISSWVDQGHDMKRSTSVSTAYSKKPDEVSKSNRKRLKPGENPRPRPKDRQMIQDRVKELREIVPNGAKCSIDALLERTIKHMLFLQSVTKHADKLKLSGDSKIISKEGGLLLRDNFEGGATWAYEVGSQSKVCPIIVEDLNPPRQMLVEMLCEERGLFLEIADIIRGLGLTILKGVMETRNDKIWARFAVEANRDVTRMEIFLSLVRLLEQTVQSTGNNNALAHQTFHHTASIPATGRPSSLQ